MGLHTAVAPLLESLGSAGRPAPLYLLVGDPSLLAPDAHALVEALQRALGGAICETLRGEEAAPERLGEVVATGSLFAPSKVIKVVEPALDPAAQGRGNRSGRKEGEEEVPAWLRGLAGRRVSVVMVCPELAGSSPIYRWAVEHGEVVRPLQAGGPREREAAAVQLARGWAREMGVELETAAARELVGMVNLDRPAALRHEVEKLAARARAQGVERITPAHVAEVCVVSREEAVFLLTDALAKGDEAALLAALARLLDQGVAPLALLNTVANYLRRLLVVGSLLEEVGVERVGEFRSFQARVLPLMKEAAGGRFSGPLKGMKPYAIYKLAAASRRFPQERLRRAVARLWRCDLWLKGEHPQPALALEGFLLELISPMARAA